MGEIILSIDTETWQSRSFALGIVYFPAEDRKEIFYKSEDMRSFLLSLVDKRNRKLQKRYKILGHNIAYDLDWIFGNYEIFFAPKWKDETPKHKRFEINYLSRNGRFYFAQYYNLMFIDTFNIFPLSLEKAGNVVGLLKGKRRDKFIKNISGYIEDLDIDYCLTDCKITYKLYCYMKNWIENKGGKIKNTIASSGLTILKAKNPNFTEYLNELNKRSGLAGLDERFRESYFGGRNEVIKLTGSELYYYDVNSEYPYVMQKQFLYPNPLSLKRSYGPLKTLLSDYEGMANVTITIPKHHIPVLPVRSGTLNKIIYPYGKINGSFNFPEIRKCIDNGYNINNVNYVIIGEPIESDWNDYVQELYQERKQLKNDNNPQEYVSKIFLNSLYGKFAQQDYDDKYVCLTDYTGFAEDIVTVNGIRFARLTTEKKRSRCDILSLASYVTSYARLNLLSHIEKCNDVYYYDTDSIITDTKLKTGDELGDLKLEYRVDKGFFKNRKDYLIFTSDNKTILRRKGISQRNIIRLNETTLTNSDLDHLRDNDRAILERIHNSDIIMFSKITKSRESIKRSLESSHYYEIEKRRLQDKDNGRKWNNNESEPLKSDKVV